MAVPGESWRSRQTVARSAEGMLSSERRQHERGAPTGDEAFEHGPDRGRRPLADQWAYRLAEHCGTAKIPVEQALQKAEIEGKWITIALVRARDRCQSGR